MATGDDAAAAGMDLVAGSTEAKTIDTEINKTRDYLAQRTSAVTPVAKGGTGATTASAARTNLDIPTFPIDASSVVTFTDATAGVNQIPRYNTTGKLATNTPTAAGHAANKSYVDGAVTDRVAKTGDTMSGHLWLPASSPALSGYTNAYIDGDGRVSRGASSERFKKYISKVDPSILGDIFPDLFTFQMRQGDGSWKFGYIAERLAESEALAPFVVWETTPDGKQLELDDAGKPVPLSIDFIALLLSQVAQLHRRLQALESQ